MKTGPFLCVCVVHVIQWLNWFKGVWMHAAYAPMGCLLCVCRNWACMIVGSIIFLGNNYMYEKEQLISASSHFNLTIYLEHSFKIHSVNDECSRCLPVSCFLVCFFVCCFSPRYFVAHTHWHCSQIFVHVRVKCVGLLVLRLYDMFSIFIPNSFIYIKRVCSTSLCLYLHTQLFICPC